MITLIKHTKRGETYSPMTFDDLAASIATASLIHEQDIPMLCFAAEWTKRKGAMVRKAFNQLCLLRVRNLIGKEEVAEAFRLAQAVPYTALLFRDRDCRSINIVCRFATAEETVTDEQQMLQYMRNAYKQLHYAYSVQLHMTIDVELPTMSQTCPWSADGGVYYNPDSLPFYAKDSDVDVPNFQVATNGRPAELRLPFENTQQALAMRFSWAYDKAWRKAREQATCMEEMHELCLELLAEYAHQEGLEKEWAIRHTLCKSTYWNREQHVRMVFENAYADELLHAVPFGSVEKSALLIMRVEAYMKSRYELRRNVLTGVVEYRERGDYANVFRPLTEMAINTMTTDALKMGLASWDKDLRRYVGSSKVMEYDPLADYLQHLPAWDGVDRIADFAQRIPTDTPRHDYYLHIWLRSMVAHWLGKDRLHGNALVPLLIGDQGCGKTSLCNIILPQQLQTYYNDKVDFRTEADIMSALSNYALINIDEFDSLKRSQQPTLKYLLTKSSVKFRPPYGKAIVERRRYASFIATTNLLHPLQDRTGSRRFACILIPSGTIVDYVTPIDYPQFYAQLLHEVNTGERYWLDDTETAELQRQNAQFQQCPEVTELIDKTLSHPTDGDTTSKSTDWHSLDDIIRHIRTRYPELEATKSLRQQLGTLLTEKGFISRRISAGKQYKCILSPL